MADLINSNSSNRSNTQTVGSAASPRPRLMSYPSAVCLPWEGERAVCRLDPFNVGRTATLGMFPYQSFGWYDSATTAAAPAAAGAVNHTPTSIRIFSAVRSSAARLSGEAAESGHCWLRERLSTRTRRQSMRTRGGEGPVRLRLLHAHWRLAC